MYRSEHILKGLSNQYYRATYKSMGFTTEDLKRPIIGIANAWSECVPGHYNLRQVAQRVKDGIYRAGGTPIEFGVIGGCDGMGQGHDGMHFIMPSRELIANSIESMAQINLFDGLVLLGSCDKIVPGMLMAAARLDIPCIFLPGGPMEGGVEFDGRQADQTSSTEAYGMLSAGKITEADVDARLDELLTLVLDTHAAVENHSRSFDADAHHALARRAAAESTVLLKNEDNLLPLAAGTKVAVIGDFAETPRYQGAGSSAVNSIKVDSLLGCWAESGLEQVGFAAGFDRQGKPDAAKQAEAVALAQKADVVLLCMGLDEIKESEGLDRSDMCVASNQIELLRALQKVNPNIVVVLSAGASVETPWANHCKALVYGALGGQAGAGAMLDVLTGKVNPSGKLAETWAMSYEDTPAKEHFAGKGRTVQYREGLYVGYRYYQTADVAPAFPFGFGLSYTSFAYSDLKATSDSVTLTVTNTGSCDGAEIVQIYVAKPDAKVFRPVQELKGFEKVKLAAGESKCVAIPLDDKAFRYWNTMTNAWEIEGGHYEIRVGASCEDIRLTATVEVAGTGAPNPYAGISLPHYESGKVMNVPDAEWEVLLDRPIPDDTVKIDCNMTLGELKHSRSPLCWLVWLVLHTMLTNSYKQGKPNLNVMFQYNMPLRALAKMTSGAISMGMVDGIVLEAKGFWGIGLCKVLVEAVKNAILNAQLEKRLRDA
mgnify:CR=1 FL=1